MCNFIMICDTIGYCIYWDVEAGETGRGISRVIANTPVSLACALPPTEPLTGFTAMPC